MFGLGPGEIVTALLLLAFALALVGAIVRLGLLPLTARLDRIIALLEARQRSPGS